MELPDKVIEKYKKCCAVSNPILKSIHVLMNGDNYDHLLTSFNNNYNSIENTNDCQKHYIHIDDELLHALIL